MSILLGAKLSMNYSDVDNLAESGEWNSNLCLISL